MLFIIYLSYIFLIRPLLEASVEIQKHFHGFFGSNEFAFEINWPLAKRKKCEYFWKNKIIEKVCKIFFWKQTKTFLISVQHHMCHRYAGEPVCSSCSSQKQGGTNQKFSCDVKPVWPRRSSVLVLFYKIMWKIIEMFLRLILILITFVFNRVNGLLDVQCRYEGWYVFSVGFFTFGN